MNRSPLLREVESLPDLLASHAGSAARRVVAIFDEEFRRTVTHDLGAIYLTGCGDSYYAGAAAELAVAQLAGLPCRALPAMQFSRFHAGYLRAVRARYCSSPYQPVAR